MENDLIYKKQKYKNYHDVYAKEIFTVILSTKRNIENHLCFKSFALTFKSICFKIILQAKV